jgi:hypothetical protein
MPNPTLKKRLLRWALNAGRGNNEWKLRKLLMEFSFTSIQEWMNDKWNCQAVQQAVSRVR